MCKRAEMPYRAICAKFDYRWYTAIAGLKCVCAFGCCFFPSFALLCGHLRLFYLSYLHIYISCRTQFVGCNSLTWLVFLIFLICLISWFGFLDVNLGKFNIYALLSTLCPHSTRWGLAVWNTTAWAMTIYWSSVCCFLWGLQVLTDIVFLQKPHWLNVSRW